MINLFKNALSLYGRKLKIILGIMLPVVLIGTLATTYLEETLGLAHGALIIPSEASIIFSLLFVFLLFLTVLIVSQLVLSATLKNERVIFSAVAFLKTLKFLTRLFWFKHFLFLFVIWFVPNAFMGIFIKPQTESLLVEQAMFNAVNFLLLLPLFHLYGFCLYKRKDQLQSSAKNS